MNTPCSYVYILTNKKNGVLYVGVTTNLLRRIWSHKEKLEDGFTKKFNVQNLVYYETHGSVVDAIKREKQLKKWKREWKIKLIEKENPEWNDLYEELC